MIYLSVICSDRRDVELESEIKRVAKDSNIRLQNWMLLMKNIKNYYVVCNNYVLI